MKLSTYQAMAMTTAAGTTDTTDFQTLLWSLALAGEAGELADLVLRGYQPPVSEEAWVMLVAASMAAEVGALLNALKKKIGHGHEVSDGDFQDLMDAIKLAVMNMEKALAGRPVLLPRRGPAPDPEKLADELGDVMWYVAGIAFINGFDLGDIGEENITKLRRRYPTGFSEEDSRNRKR